MCRHMSELSSFAPNISINTLKKHINKHPKKYINKHPSKNISINTPQKILQRVICVKCGQPSGMISRAGAKLRARWLKHVFRLTVLQKDISTKWALSLYINIQKLFNIFIFNWIIYILKIGTGVLFFQKRPSSFWN